MSVLLDALKRAEQNRKKQEELEAKQAAGEAPVPDSQADVIPEESAPTEAVAEEQPEESQGTEAKPAATPMESTLQQDAAAVEVDAPERKTVETSALLAMLQKQQPMVADPRKEAPPTDLEANAPVAPPKSGSLLDVLKRQQPAVTETDQTAATPEAAATDMTPEPEEAPAAASSSSLLDVLNRQQPAVSDPQDEAPVTESLPEPAPEPEATSEAASKPASLLATLQKQPPAAAAPQEVAALKLSSSEAAVEPEAPAPAAAPPPSSGLALASGDGPMEQPPEPEAKAPAPAVSSGGLSLASGDQPLTEPAPAAAAIAETAPPVESGLALSSATAAPVVDEEEDDEEADSTQPSQMRPASDPISTPAPASTPAPDPVAVHGLEEDEDDEADATQPSQMVPKAATAEREAPVERSASLSLKLDAQQQAAAEAEAEAELDQTTGSLLVALHSRNPDESAESGSVANTVEFDAHFMEMDEEEEAPAAAQPRAEAQPAVTETRSPAQAAQPAPTNQPEATPAAAPAASETSGQTEQGQAASETQGGEPLQSVDQLFAEVASGHRKTRARRIVRAGKKRSGKGLPWGKVASFLLITTLLGGATWSFQQGLLDPYHPEIKQWRAMLFQPERPPQRRAQPTRVAAVNPANSGGQAVAERMAQVPAPPAPAQAPTKRQGSAMAQDPMMLPEPGNLIPRVILKPGPEMADTPIPQRPAERQAAEPSASRVPVDSPPATQAKGKGEMSIVKHDPAKTIKANLKLAKRALSAGQTNKAQRYYHKVLKLDEENRNAHLGMASSWMMMGLSERAKGLYLALLEKNPKDHLAMAGLLSLSSLGSDPKLESRIKQLIHEKPDSAHYRFILGVLYASRLQWQEAQAAYFQAMGIDPESADIAFNLAVSLDHLKEADSALTYYKKALTLHKQRPGRFNHAAVESRISRLEESAKGRGAEDGQLAQPEVF
uniref:Uncharacterized protein n=1 Tax=Magnetococcus massalia (strain MO-1) TaxID=451514 RepID=A0A1S7LJD5_MAGMO|nr:protein of unknown function [Candidatus Magnetococcus massalia]